MQTHTCNDSSSAANFTTWIGTGGHGCVPDSGVELETDVLFGPLPGGLLATPTHVIHVRAEPLTTNPLGGAEQSGIVQVFAPPNTGPNRVVVSVWVYVVRGSVATGVGNSGSTGTNIPNTKTGEWEQLIGVNEGTPANQFALYSTAVGGSEFYADDAVVCPADTELELTACQVYVRQSR